MNEFLLGTGDTSFRRYVARVLEPWSPVLVANRAPYDPTPDGGFVRGSGGLVTAFLTLTAVTGADCVACARNQLERGLGASGRPVEASIDGQICRIHYVPTTDDLYHQYYSVVSNPLIWFLQHYLWDLSRVPVVDHKFHRAWHRGYVAINQAVAARAAEVAGATERPPLVMIHDYQLYLAPRGIRERLENATLMHFTHIPWPTPQYWKVLPPQMRDSIVDGLLACDLVGFQTQLDVRNFLLTCEENMGLKADHRQGVVFYRGRATWVRAYPISINPAQMRQLAESDAVRREIERLRPGRPEHLIVRVDRADLSKNIVRGFLAYERLLRRYPRLRGKTEFWAFLQPTRSDVADYRSYLGRIHATAHRINQEIGSERWRPIRLEIGENHPKAVAAFTMFDVLLVNPIYDGMNLVAKEGMLVNRRDGALVLSENAGAHMELGQYALSINPFDVDQTADAIYAALTMPGEERRARLEGIRSQIETNDLANWLSRQLQDLVELIGTPDGRRSR